MVLIQQSIWVYTQVFCEFPPHTAILTPKETSFASSQAERDNFMSHNLHQTLRCLKSSNKYLDSQTLKVVTCILLILILQQPVLGLEELQLKVELSHQLSQGGKNKDSWNRAGDKPPGLPFFWCLLTLQLRNVMTKMKSKVRKRKFLKSNRTSEV